MLGRVARAAGVLEQQRVEEGRARVGVEPDLLGRGACRSGTSARRGRSAGPRSGRARTTGRRGPRRAGCPLISGSRRGRATYGPTAPRGDSCASAARSSSAAAAASGAAARAPPAPRSAAPSSAREALCGRRAWRVEGARPPWSAAGRASRSRPLLCLLAFVSLARAAFGLEPLAIGPLGLGAQALSGALRARRGRRAEARRRATHDSTRRRRRR